MTYELFICFFIGFIIGAILNRSKEDREQERVYEEKYAEFQKEILYYKKLLHAVMDENMQFRREQK